MADYDEAIRLDPNYAIAFSRRGRCLRNLGDYDQALAGYTEAIRLDPELVEAYSGAAWLLATCPDDAHRDGAKAFQYAAKACQLSQWSDGDAIDSLAAAYAESGDFAKAVEYEQKAILLAGEQADDYQNRLELYQARQPYRQAPPDRPDSPAESVAARPLP
jgi:tetratricopeptide (TPR) repeat protein